MLALAIEFTGAPVELAASADSAFGGPSMGRAAGGGSPVSVAIAEGRHPVPFRTRKLSLPAPMVLPWRRGGGVGRRRDIFEPEPPSGGSVRCGAAVSGSRGG